MKQMEGMMVMMQTLIDADGNGSQDSAKRAADAQAEKDAANKLSQGEGKFLCKTPFSEEEILEAFGVIDMSSDGYVSMSEIKFVLDALGEAVTDEEVDEMIKMIDFDGDGQVNKAEFARMARGESLLPLGAAIPVPKSLDAQANDDEKIRKAEDIIRQKKAAGEKIDFSIDSHSLSESEITESEASSDEQNREDRESEAGSEY
jgi:hypothetical protein